MLVAQQRDAGYDAFRQKKETTQSQKVDELGKVFGFLGRQYLLLHVEGAIIQERRSIFTYNSLQQLGTRVIDIATSRSFPDASS